MNKSFFIKFLMVSMTAVLAPSVLADTVKLHGSTTVVNALVTPYRVAVEKASGQDLEIVGNGTGKGLVDLIDGKADASMSSDSLAGAVAAAETTGKKIDTKSLQFHVVKKDEAVFVVHPSNPVTSLSWEQIRDIHTGKITNWKQVGGKDLPITGYSEQLTGGVGGLMHKTVMGGAEYAANIKIVTSQARVAEMVQKDEGGIGGAGKSFIDGAKNKILQTKKIETQLGFITVGDPSEKVKRVIDAFKVASK